jgi:hypothetical protein
MSTTLTTQLLWLPGLSDDDPIPQAVIEPWAGIGCRDLKEPTWLYHLFTGGDGETSDRLLYIGIAAQLRRRMRQHAATKRWWQDVEQVVAIVGCCRRHVLIEESEHIAAAWPLYNVSRPSIHLNTFETGARIFGAVSLRKDRGEL